MIDKIADASGTGTISLMISGIQWAVSNQAKIISISMGTWQDLHGATNCDSYQPSLTTAVNNAVAAGVTVVAEAGNNPELGQDVIDTPACISSVIAVGVVNNQDQWSSSQYGEAMQDHGFAAPGVNLYSAWISGGNYGSCRDAGTYAYCDGASMATPVVSGTAALLLSRNFDLTPSTIRSSLNSSADCVLSPCPNIYIGHGRVNASRAVATVAAKTVLVGIVTDAATGAYLSGVQIDVTNAARSYQTTTGSAGQYSLAVTADTYAVAAYRCDYDTVSVTLGIVSGVTTPRYFSVTKSSRGTLSGYVFDTWGNGLGAAAVSSCSLSTKTNGQGHYSFSVYAGHLIPVSASAKGYRPDSTWVTVPVGGSASHDFILQCSRDPCPIRPP